MNIKFIKNDKFKSNSITLNIPMDLDEKVTDLNLVTEMIKVGSKKYDSFKNFIANFKRCTELNLIVILISMVKSLYLQFT